MLKASLKKFKTDHTQTKEQCLKIPREKSVFNLEYFLPNYIKIHCKRKTKTFSAIQRTSNLYMPCTLSYKATTGCASVNNVANPKRRLSYPGNRNDPREQLCTRSKGQPYLASSEVPLGRKKKWNQ